MSEAADQASASPLEVYEDMKSRIQRLGMRMEDFADAFGVARTTVPRWRSAGTPLYALRFLAALEALHVEPPANRQFPSNDDKIVPAMRPAVSRIIDSAISGGWTRGQIANAMRVFANETDGGSL